MFIPCHRCGVPTAPDDLRPYGCVRSSCAAIVERRMGWLAVGGKAHPAIRETDEAAVEAMLREIRGE